MKKNKFFAGLSALAMLTLAAGCSDDLRPDGGPDINGSEADGPGVYMGVNITMPTGGNGTRSTTTGENQSSDGTEPGTAVENNINEVLLVLARPNDYGFIAASTVSQNGLSKESEKSYLANAKFELSDLNQYYDPAPALDANGKLQI